MAHIRKYAYLLLPFLSFKSDLTIHGFQFFKVTNHRISTTAFSSWYFKSNCTLNFVYCWQSILVKTCAVLFMHIQKILQYIAADTGLCKSLTFTKLITTYRVQVCFLGEY